MSRNYQVVKGNDIKDLESQVSYKRTTGWKCQGGVCVTAINDVACEDVNLEPIETDTDLIYYQAMVKGFL